MALFFLVNGDVDRFNVLKCFYFLHLYFFSVSDLWEINVLYNLKGTSVIIPRKNIQKYILQYLGSRKLFLKFKKVIII